MHLYTFQDSFLECCLSRSHPEKCNIFYSAISLFWIGYIAIIFDDRQVNYNDFGWREVYVPSVLGKYSNI